MADLEAEWNSFINGNETPEYWTPYPIEREETRWADDRDDWEHDHEIDVFKLTSGSINGFGYSIEPEKQTTFFVKSDADAVAGAGADVAGGVAVSSGSTAKIPMRTRVPKIKVERPKNDAGAGEGEGGGGGGGGGISLGMISAPLNSVAPEPLPLYISTKSIITYFNSPIDIQEMFWKLEVHPYTTAAECVIKKEIKLTSNTPEEVEEIKRKIAGIPYVKEHIITHLNAADGRTKFKDVRKIIVGLSKKDITSCRIKQKGAFYNCLVMIMRIQMDKEAAFREVHVKVFNTGKIEIPGIQTDSTLQYILDKLIFYLQPLTQTHLSFQDTTRETVLINSNFNCQFYINREAMFTILRSKYRVQCWYDPCCYPGIRCKYTDAASNLANISFMIFRTGSVLIVGKCNEDGIYRIYEYVKNILRTEYENIHQPLTEVEQLALPVKKKTIRKRKIYVEDTNL
jgi:TATA-box binding protein (TBP) (component of TFIID and TFIIIB)